MLFGFIRDHIVFFYKSGRAFAQLDQAVKEEGFMLVLLLRCSPLHPYAILNYALGVTSIPLIEYAAASFFGMLPATIMEVFPA